MNGSKRKEYIKVMKSKINVVELWRRIEECKEVKWRIDGTAVLMATEASGGVPEPFATLCKDAINELEELVDKKVVHLMVNRLPGGCIVPVHTDPVLYNPERYHLPLVTDIRHVYFWDEVLGFQFMEIGKWYKIDYSVRHAIGNYGATERVHLILDVK